MEIKKELTHSELVALYKRSQKDDDLTLEELEQLDELRCVYSSECPGDLEDCDYRCPSKISGLIDYLKDQR